MQDFLPVTKKEMKQRGWEQVDFAYITGDAYVDHPSFGTAIISRLLESRGYKVGIIPQPDWRKKESIQVFGEPRLGFLVSAGNMDSMVNHYTVSKKHRQKDSYSPGGQMGLRPDRAVIVYSNLIRQTYKKTPIILGGIEASLRRLAHYDYWENKVKHSVLLDSGADMISYGMGEHSIIEIADALASGLPVEELTYIAGTVFKCRDLSRVYDPIILPSYEEVKVNKKVYAESEKLNSVQDKVRESVEQQIQSERLKIELVTNVSHDLKTPLTSIISYIDLLKKMDLDDEASSYVKILDKKAQKLKGIVSDVFSIAKATSGVDVNLTKLDFVMLLNQCIADAEDKIADSGKIVKININADSAMVMGDGDKLYRVFQNIVDNALNYSMDGTRIFLDVYKKADRIVFAEKNISATPINFTEEEILERFVRGDKSRTDGGSGLGLSISKSFTEACGGIFNIEIDGDMFKAIVEMPIIQEDTAEKTDDKTE